MHLYVWFNTMEMLSFKHQLLERCHLPFSEKKTLKMYRHSSKTRLKYTTVFQRWSYVLCLWSLTPLHVCNNGISLHLLGFPGDSDSKEPTCNTGDPGSIFGLERSPRDGNGCHLQYPCLENSMDRGVWQATVHGVVKSWTWLSD